MAQIKQPAEKQAPGFMIYDEISEALLALRDEELGAIIRAAIGYKLYSDSNPKIPAGLMFPFRLLKGTIDRDCAKYVERCEKNRASANERWNK